MFGLYPAATITVFLFTFNVLYPHVSDNDTFVFPVSSGFISPENPPYIFTVGESEISAPPQNFPLSIVNVPEELPILIQIDHQTWVAFEFFHALNLTHLYLAEALSSVAPLISKTQAERDNPFASFLDA